MDSVYVAQPLTYLGNSLWHSCKSEAQLAKLDNGRYRFIFELTGVSVFLFGKR